MPRHRPDKCECDRPATELNVAREWVCSVCRDRERRGKEIKERYANNGRVKAVKGPYIRKDKKILNFAEMYNDALETPLESLSRLEQMLADPARTLLTAVGGRV